MASLFIDEIQYQARILNGSDEVTAIYTDFTALYYKKAVNQIGMAILTVPEDHPIIATLTDDLLLEIYISYRNAVDIVSHYSITWSKDFMCLYRDYQIATDEDGNRYYLLYFPGIMDILSRNVIAYGAGVNDKTQWTLQHLDIIADDMVRWNCTPDATTINGRLRDASIIRSLEAGGFFAASPIVDFTASNKNVLEALQEIANIGGFDFDIERDNSVPGNMLFTEYQNQLGTDRSTTVIFDPALDNVAKANLSGDRLREKTVAIVGGVGTGTGRDYSIRTGANQSASNDYEIFIDARTSTTAELPTIGDARLSELQAKRQLDFEIAPSLGLIYKRDYGLGDLVTGSFGDYSATKKIHTVEVRFDQDQLAAVRIELEDVL